MQVADNEEALSTLCYSEIGGVKYKLSNIVTDVFKGCLQFTVAGPWPHMDDILHDEPAWPEFLSVP